MDERTDRLLRDLGRWNAEKLVRLSEASGCRVNPCHQLSFKPLALLTVLIITR